MHHYDTVAIMRVLRIKTYTQMTNRKFDEIFKLLRAALPEMNFPKSYTEAKKSLYDVGLGFETIHICK